MENVARRVGQQRRPETTQAPPTRAERETPPEVRLEREAPEAEGGRSCCWRITGGLAGLCGEATTLARCGDRKNAYRNACVTYQMHLDCETSSREVCITCDIVVRFMDVLATFA